MLHPAKTRTGDEDDVEENPLPKQEEDSKTRNRQIVGFTCQDDRGLP
jgi:hypothetical protein